MMLDKPCTAPLRDFVESTLVMSSFLNNLIVKIDQGKCPSPEELRGDALIALGLMDPIRKMNKEIQEKVSPDPAIEPGYDIDWNGETYWPIDQQETPQEKSSEFDRNGLA